MRSISTVCLMSMTGLSPSSIPLLSSSALKCFFGASPSICPSSPVLTMQTPVTTRVRQPGRTALTASSTRSTATPRQALTRPTQTSTLSTPLLMIPSSVSFPHHGCLRPMSALSTSSTSGFLIRFRTLTFSSSSACSQSTRAASSTSRFSPSC